MNAFLLPLLGGALIGVSATLLLLFNGRVAGISGITGGLIAPARGETGWRLAFLAGLLGGGFLLAALLPSAFGKGSPSHLGLTILAGLLVGFGTRLGNGCTSGHGVCGLSRASRRSLAATLTFMLIAALTVYATRHLIGGLS